VTTHQTTDSEPVLTVTGLFRDVANADRAYRLLTADGYGEESIGILMTEETRERTIETEDSDVVSSPGRRALEGASIGTTVGGTVGALMGALAALGPAIVAPGIGLVIAGPLAATLAGAGAGGASGGILGAVVGAIVPEDSVPVYEESIRTGGILMTVVPRSRSEANRIAREWESLGAEVVRG